ncbi:trans-sulfuration enzyme family protein [Thermovenabulum gondwanense]|uniref:homocysteine desulfhydrase n=1 Tax=Thermovenabulum gondwanense TaxID=520767 RepID=A0A162MCI9_9FIRM|nr:PLP-dependent aspartate aminotransferase family protein [Thermovenabulum gondwanense]KYO65255.1 Methionine gamma-lyase [Thermovenabulum gondwanense]
MEIKRARFGTKAVHAGQQPDKDTGALNLPMFLTSTFVFTPEKMERYLSGNKEGIFTYGRSRNPTQNSFQEKIASLENAPAALATSSGMAAITLAILSFVHPGDHIISVKTIYGGTHALFTKIFKELKIEITFVDSLSEEELLKSKKPNTKLIYIESILNPTLEVPDIPTAVDFAKKNGLKVIVDNTFTTPYLFKPYDIGVDIIVHSTTKYINGHGDHLGGIILGDKDYIENIRSGIYQEFGPVPSPFACWLGLRGVKTLHLRMRQHCENADKFARWLKGHPYVEGVVYPGLEEHPQHELAKKLFKNGFGGMVSFMVKGGLKDAQRVINNLKMAHYAVSLGDLDTLVQHPATMTHGKIAKEERLKMGIPDNMIRVSVGVEEIEDIIEDFEQALEKAYK